MSWRQFFTSNLLDYLVAAHPTIVQKGETPEEKSDADDALEKVNLGIDVAEGKEIPPDERRPLSLFACALAFCKLEKVLGEFWERSPELRVFLSDGELSPSEASSPPSRQIPDANEEKAQQADNRVTDLIDTSAGSSNAGTGSLTTTTLKDESKASPSPSPNSRIRVTAPLIAEPSLHRSGFEGPSASQVSRLEKMIASLPDHLPPDKLARAADLLIRFGRSHKQLHQKVVAVQTRLNEGQRDISALPWLKGSPTFNLIETTLVSRDQLEQLSAQLRSVEQVLQIHQQLTTLCERLGDQPGAFVPAGSTLFEVTELMQVRAADYQTRLQEISRREKAVSEFLDGFLNATSEAGLVLLREANDSLWLDLVAIIVDAKPQADGSSLFHLVGNAKLLGIASVALWPQRQQLATKILEAVVHRVPSNHGWTIDDVFIRFPTDILQLIPSDCPSIAPEVIQHLFISALYEGDGAALEYLPPLLEFSTRSGSCDRLYRTALEMHRRGILANPRQQFIEVSQGTKSPPGDHKHAERFRQELLDFSRLAPREGLNYFKLRKLAQHKYLEPLVSDIKSNSSAKVRRRWNDYGDLEQMVQNCVTESGLRKELTQSHFDETRKFLEQFEERLQRWESSQPRTEPSVDSTLRLAFHGLEQAAHHNDSQALNLLRAIHALSTSEPASRLTKRTCAIQDNNAVLLDTSHMLVQEMTRCWPIFLQGHSVPAFNYLADSLRQAIAPLTRLQALEDYLRRGEFQAAFDVTQDDSTLRDRVNSEVTGRRNALRAKHSDVLVRAGHVEDRDEYIHLYLEEIDRALESLQFEAAEKNVAELEPLVRRQEMLADPERQNVLGFLRDGGEVVDDDEASMELLSARATDLRRRRQDQRLHIAELNKHCNAGSVPAGLPERLKELASYWDRPSHWVDPELSLELADYLEKIFHFLTSRFRRGQKEMAAQLGDWVCVQWCKDAHDKTHGPLRVAGTLKGLAEAISDHATDEDILKIIGASALPPDQAPLEASEPLKSQLGTQIPTADVLTGSSSPEAAIEVPRRTGETAERNQLSASGTACVTSQAEASDTIAAITARLRSYLRERANQEAPPDPLPSNIEKELRTAARAWHWKTARPLAGAVLRAGPLEGSLSPIEACFAVALARTTLEDDLSVQRLAYQHACLAVLLTWEPESGLLREDVRTLILVRTIAEFHEPVSLSDESAAELAEKLREALQSWSDLSDSDPSLRPVTWFFQQASVIVCPDNQQAVVRLAGTLWKAVRQLESSEAIASARGDLLQLLYRLRQSTALRHLSAESPQIIDLISQCLSAFEQADGNPALLPEAGIYAAAYRDQAAGKNYKPWLQLFDYLEAAADEDDVAVQCEAVSDFVAREQNGGATIQVRVTPSRTDRPSKLTIELGTAEALTQHQNLLGDDEALLKEKIFELRLPPELVSSADELIGIPYHLTGQTIRRRPIDLRGTWQMPFASQVVRPLNDDELLAAWPGAKRAVVRLNRGFHGREKQIKKIEKMLLDRDRPHSILLIGERRIGKTSLLYEMVRTQEPSQGRVCGVFCDAEGLNLKATGSMTRVFFDFIVRYALQDDANEQLQAALRQHKSPAALRALEQPEWLAAKFDPDASFKIALEQLTEWLHRHTDKRVPRLALYVDEFDKFVEPLLTDRAAEVNKLMWGLREIVQRSPRVALVLSGSGLLRLFVQGLDQPLHESIYKLSLEPFEPNDQSDWKAVGDTFLPPHVRKRVCPERHVDSLIKHAAVICGCHPYYLAMLGYAAAVDSCGYPLSPAVLNRVVERMIKGKFEASRTEINSEKFYHGLFVSLDRLANRSKAIAKTLLVAIARRTTTELPFLPKWHLVLPPHADPEIVDLTTEEERWQAYSVLLMERAFEEDPGKSRVRMRVPLTAAALRHDAVDIRNNALQTLRAKKGDRSE